MRISYWSSDVCSSDLPKKLSPVLCAIAAMSNNRGGFLFLGVSNADCKAVGVSDAFAGFDVAKLMNKVKVHLAPTPVITTKEVIGFDGTKIGFVHGDRKSTRLNSSH